MKAVVVRPGAYCSSLYKRRASSLLTSVPLCRQLLAVAAPPAALALSAQGGTPLGIVALIVLGALWRQGWRTQGSWSDALRVAIVLGSVASFNLLFLGAFHELAGAVLLLTALGVALQLAWATHDARARRVEVALVLGASALTLALLHSHVSWPHLVWAAPWLAAGLLAPVWEWAGTHKRTNRP